MKLDTLFCHLSTRSISELIHNAQHSVCFAGPGIQTESATELIEAASRLGAEMITVCIDFDEKVLRMGYGDIAAVKCLMDSEITVNHSSGLRNALIIVDGEGYAYTPNALLLEPDREGDGIRNALRLSGDQVSEALARLSPAAKIIAIARAESSEEKTRIRNIPVEVCSNNINENRYSHIEKSLADAPPVSFDIARQVRVFEPYLQYVEISLTGASLQSNKIEIPKTISQTDSDDDLSKRLRTTFSLIADSSDISSQSIDRKLDAIRKNITPSLGKGHGRVVLRSGKQYLVEQLDALDNEIEDHRQKVKAKLDECLNSSKKEIVDHYLSSAMNNPHQSLRSQCGGKNPTEEKAKRWLLAELDKVFPKTDSLIRKIKLERVFKDVTYETLNQPEFIDKVKDAFSAVDWESLYEEYQAIGENGA